MINKIIDTFDEAVLDTRIAKHVLPGLADEMGTAELLIAVAVDPGLAVGLGVENP